MTLLIVSTFSFFGSFDSLSLGVQFFLTLFFFFCNLTLNFRLIFSFQGLHFYPGVTAMQFDSCESLQPLIPICPSGDVSKRTKEALMDTLPPAPVHPFRPSMPLFSSIQNNKPFRNSTRGSWPSVVCTAGPEFFFPSLFFFPRSPLLKPPLAPVASRRLRKARLCRPSVAAVSAG